MKYLKFAPKHIPAILSGEKTATWRVFDDKDLTTGDAAAFVNAQTDAIFAYALLSSVTEKCIADINEEDWRLQAAVQCSLEELCSSFSRIYARPVSPDTRVKMQHS